MNADKPVGYSRSPRVKRALFLLLGSGIVAFTVMLAYGDRAAEPISLSASDTLQIAASASVGPVLSSSAAYTLRELDIHPARLYPPVFLGLRPPRSTDSPHYHDFYNLLDVYAKRQGVDDNFTLRVMDNRSGALLELHSLERERGEYHAAGYADWDAVDRERRTATRSLVDKYEKLGVPREHISVRWGRSDQVREARERKSPIIEYELRLAQSLGLSLLPTEIGTVETFNQDHLVSRAGARSRYQMMPNFLRMYNLSDYRLNASAGNAITVRDELHPLLALEPAFIIVKAYSNAVGHEIPGISAYHTGPGNIFNVYRSFLLDPENLAMFATRDISVVDAFIWGLTDGFPVVRENSTFRDQSRGYIPAAMGTLRAVENYPIDPSRTLRLERVQLAPDRQIRLARLLSLLETHGPDLDWGHGAESIGAYERFRNLNPHILLPPAVESDDVPAAGNINLQSQAQKADIRFFLPKGSMEVLEKAGHPLVDATSVFLYDESTFSNPVTTGEVTEWDLMYDLLVESISRFGFTPAHRDRLKEISAQLDLLSKLNPSRYRITQARVAALHLRMWQSPPWEKLSETVVALSGSIFVPPRPPLMPSRIEPRPVEIGTKPLPSPR